MPLHKTVTAQDIYEDVFFKELNSDEKLKLDNFCENMKRKAVDDYLLSHPFQSRNPFGPGKSVVGKVIRGFTEEQISVVNGLVNESRLEALKEMDEAYWDNGGDPDYEKIKKLTEEYKQTN